MILEKRTLISCWFRLSKDQPLKWIYLTKTWFLSQAPFSNDEYGWQKKIFKFLWLSIRDKILSNSIPLSVNQHSEKVE